MLDLKNIQYANSASQFNAGDAINRDAIAAYERFDATFDADDYNDAQRAYLDERRASWKRFVAEHYNDQARRRGDTPPWTVTGPSNYPAARIQKKVRAAMKRSEEFSEKAQRFFANTEKALKALKALVPIEQQIADIRNGKWHYGEAISADDANAIEKIKAKIASLKESQESMKAANRVIRKHKGDEAKQIAALVDMKYTEAQARELITPDFCGRIGHPDYSLSNNLANIKRYEQRLAAIERNLQRETKEEETAFYTYREVPGDNRIHFLFDGKPDEKTRAILKRHGFKWSPSRPGKPWVRQLTTNGLYAAERVKKELAEVVS